MTSSYIFLKLLDFRLYAGIHKVFITLGSLISMEWVPDPGILKLIIWRLSHARTETAVIKKKTIEVTKMN